MRKLYLLNESGEMYDFTFRNRTLVSGISDLGFSKDLTYLNYPNDRLLVGEKNANGSISLDLVFLDGYQGYKEFIEYKGRSTGRLKLCYEVKKEMKYVYVAIKSMNKKQLEACILKSTLTLDKLSVWFKDVSSTIMITEPTEGKVYTYKYPYVYGAGYDGSVEITNNGELLAGLGITISGSVRNPSLTVLKGNDVYGTLKLMVESENCEIDISASEENQYMLLNEDGYVTNIYGKQDFTCENFIFIEPGTYTVRFDPGTENPGTYCVITFREGYSGH